MNNKKRKWYQRKQPKGLTTVVTAIALAIGAVVFLYDSPPDLKLAYCALSCVTVAVFFLIFAVSTDQ